VLLEPGLSGLQPSPWEWIAVMAFYAAVHCVNAYLWETRHFAPLTHRDRRLALQNAPQIRSCANSYGSLNLAGYHARYTETFSLSERDARTLLQVDCRGVEAIVMQALGQPAPTW
jgi:hypothetical protein